MMYQASYYKYNLLSFHAMHKFLMKLVNSADIENTQSVIICPKTISVESQHIECVAH